jgi:murein L,D-transpeptidase YafK
MQSTSFKQTQLQHGRVKKAYEEKERIVKEYFRQKKINDQGFNLFIRVFKHDEKLEVWVQQKGKITYELLHTYAICASSGTVGPKRKEGDMQVPEGVYHVAHFNPQSNFYLSLGVNYPNASDQVLSDSKYPGGNIYIHGNCVTVGCLPLTDDKIKELYVLAVEARNDGQLKIPVHIFPTYLNEGSIDKLIQDYDVSDYTIDFWKNLQPIYQHFEATHALPVIRVNKKGEYYF